MHRNLTFQAFFLYRRVMFARELHSKYFFQINYRVIYARKFFIPSFFIYYRAMHVRLTCLVFSLITELCMHVKLAFQVLFIYYRVINRMRVKLKFEFVSLFYRGCSENLHSKSFS